MSTNWYYVDNNERVGPIDEGDFLDLILKTAIKEDTYVWRKGLDNWVQAKSLDELRNYFYQSLVTDSDHIGSNKGNDYTTEASKTNHDINDSDSNNIIFDWNKVDSQKSIFVLKIGIDRGVAPKEYGPYSIAVISKLIKEKRVNHLTQVFAPGMSDWEYLSEVPSFENLFSEKSDFKEKRSAKRCPISARVFLSDDENFFQGVCRDVSVGGAQVLVANFPGKEGDIVKINMHFEDGSFAFTASGKIIRILSRVGGFAMRYVNLGPDAITMINNYIENYES